MAVSKKEQMLRKVRALLAQAEDPTVTPEEAKAFSEKAEELLVKFGIDQAMLDAAKPKGRGKPASRQVPMVAPYKMPKLTLLYQIANAYGVRMVYYRREYSTMVGFEADLDAIDLLYTSLLLQLTNALNAAKKESGKTGEALVTFAESFINGFAAEVGRRLGEQRRKTTEATSGAALVLADRQDEVDAAFRDLFPHTRSARSRGGRTDYDGWSRGGHAGRNADLGNTRIGGRKAISA